MSRTKRITALRAIAAPFVVSSPRGGRIRTRLRASERDSSVLRQVGDHVGHLYAHIGRVFLALPVPLRHLANAPRGRYQLTAPVTFAHRGSQWG